VAIQLGDKLAALKDERNVPLQHQLPCSRDLRPKRRIFLPEISHPLLQDLQSIFQSVQPLFPLEPVLGRGLPIPVLLRNHALLRRLPFQLHSGRGRPS